MNLGALGDTLLFDPSNFSFNSGGQRGMTWGDYLKVQFPVTPPAGSAVLLSQGGDTYGAEAIINNNGNVSLDSNGRYVGVSEVSLPQFIGSDGNSYSIFADTTAGESSTYSGSAEFVSFLQSWAAQGYKSVPASAIPQPTWQPQIPQNYLNWVSSQGKMGLLEQAYVNLNNAPKNSPDTVGMLILAAAVVGIGALALTGAGTIAAATSTTSGASAATTGEVTTTGTGGTAAAAAPTASVTAAPVGTATITPVSSADVSTLTAEGFPTSAIASPLTSTGTASAVSTAAEAATSSPTSLLTSGAGLLKQAAPAIAAGTALVKKIFGAQTATVAPGTYVPAQRRINPLFIGAGILLLAVAVKKGGGRKGKHHEPRTDFIR